MISFSNLLPLCLYIHIPWCVKKCPYCDFNSHALKRALPQQDYIQQLLLDLASDRDLMQNRSIDAIFIGGGTPSLFDPEMIKLLINEVQNIATFSPHIEITLEANPGTVEQNRFEGFRQAGVNRLSIGIQSFQAQKLKKLGRIHDNSEAINAVIAAKNAGFTNFNLDLMFGLPGQTIDDAMFDLQTAIHLNPTHLSWYQLTLEPNTVFHHQPPVLPEDDLIGEMQEQGQALLAANGFKQYEVSAYAREGFQCRHNLNYWLFGDYIGIGAGAHGKISFVQDGITMIRTIKQKQPQQYLLSNLSQDASCTAPSEIQHHNDIPSMSYSTYKNPFLLEHKIIPCEEIAFEFMLNALRLSQPISIQTFMTRTGLNFTEIESCVKLACEKELLKYKDDYLQVTSLGRRFLNDLMQLFLVK